MTNHMHVWKNNSAFTHGDAVFAYFFRQNGKLILCEDSYFHLMSSMRRLRMNIPLSFTLEYFIELIENENKKDNGIFQLMVFPEAIDNTSNRITHWLSFRSVENILNINQSIEIDILKELSVNTHFISNIRTYCPENRYAEIYAKENDLNDVILLNPQKRIARTIHGNLLLLKENQLRVVKPSEGAYISPLMESFITFVHKNQKLTFSEAEIAPFETQQAEEILLISDSIGIQSVAKIRSKTFGNEIFQMLLSEWQKSLEGNL